MTILRGKNLSELLSPDKPSREVEKGFMEVVMIQNGLRTLDDVYSGKNILTYFNKGTEAEKAQNRAETEKLICFLILSYANSLNIPAERKPSASQIIELSSFLIEDAKYDRLEDLILALKWAKHGRYGEIYGRVDVPTILGIWSAYKAEKEDHFHSGKMREIESYKERSYEMDFENGLVEGRRRKIDTAEEIEARRRAKVEKAKREGRNEYRG